MQNFTAYLEESYFYVLLTEGKGQHQVVKQFGPRIVDRLIAEYQKLIKQQTMQGRHVVLTDEAGRPMNSAPEGSTEHITTLHPDAYARKLKDSMGSDPEASYKALAKEMGIPEKPEYLDLEDSEDLDTWDKHVNWLLTRYATGSHTTDEQGNVKVKGIGSIRDISGVLENLKKYHEHVKTGAMKAESLSKWQNAKDIEDAVKKQDPLGAGLPKGSYDIVGDNEHWTVVTPKTAEAACKLGSGSNWCTTAWAFDGYASRGPLYIMLPKKQGQLNVDPHYQGQLGTVVPEKYQLHMEGSEQAQRPQFMKPDQQELSAGELKSILDRPFPGIVDKLSKIALSQGHYRYNIGQPTPQITEADADELFKNGHYQLILEKYPNILTKDKYIYGLTSSKTTQSVKTALLAHLLSDNRPNRGATPHDSVMSPELIEHLIRYGNGGVVVNNRQALVDKGYTEGGKEGYMHPHSPTQLRKMVAAMMLDPKPGIAHTQTINDILRSTHASHMLFGSFDDDHRNETKNLLKQFMQIQNPTRAHSDALGDLLQRYNMHLSDSPLTERERANDVRDLVPHIMAQPSIGVKVKALHDFSNTYDNLVFQPEHVDSIVDEFFKTKYPKILRRQANNEHIEDTSHDDAEKLIATLRFIRPQAFFDNHFAQKVFGGNSTAAKTLYVRAVTNDPNRQVPPIQTEQLTKAIKEEPEFAYTYLKHFVNRNRGTIAPEHVEIALSPKQKNSGLARYVAEHVARHENNYTPELQQHFLRTMVDSPHSDVREQAAYNETLPGESLHKLLDDPSSGVRNIAARHRNITIDHLEKLISQYEDATDEEKVGDDGRKNGNLIVDMLDRDPPTKRYGLTQSITPRHIDRLLDLENDDITRSMLRHFTFDPTRERHQNLKNFTIPITEKHIKRIMDIHGDDRHAMMNPLSELMSYHPHLGDSYLNKMYTRAVEDHTTMGGHLESMGNFFHNLYQIHGADIRHIPSTNNKVLQYLKDLERRAVEGHASGDLEAKNTRRMLHAGLAKALVQEHDNMRHANSGINLNSIIDMMHGDQQRYAGTDPMDTISTEHKGNLYKRMSSYIHGLKESTDTVEEIPYHQRQKLIDTYLGYGNDLRTRGSESIFGSHDSSFADLIRGLHKDKDTELAGYTLNKFFENPDVHGPSTIRSIFSLNLAAPHISKVVDHITGMDLSDPSTRPYKLKQAFEMSRSLFEDPRAITSDHAQKLLDWSHSLKQNPEYSADMEQIENTIPHGFANSRNKFGSMANIIGSGLQHDIIDNTERKNDSLSFMERNAVNHPELLAVHGLNALRRSADAYEGNRQNYHKMLEYANNKNYDPTLRTIALGSFFTNAYANSYNSERRERMAQQDKHLFNTENFTDLYRANLRNYSNLSYRGDEKERTNKSKIRENLSNLVNVAHSAQHIWGQDFLHPELVEEILNHPSAEVVGGFLATAAPHIIRRHANTIRDLSKDPHWLTSASDNQETTDPHISPALKERPDWSYRDRIESAFRQADIPLY